MVFVLTSAYWIKIIVNYLGTAVKVIRVTKVMCG
jgi:hypothetical protein